MAMGIFSYLRVDLCILLDIWQCACRHLLSSLRGFAAIQCTRGMSTCLGDFAPLQPAPTVAGACKTVAGASVSAEQGEKRKWLKIYETLPNQLLNAYGAAKYIRMSDSDMWVEMKRPLATGAASMSELCFLDEERKGVGVSRWLQVCESFCMYRQMPSTKQQN